MAKGMTVPDQKERQQALDPNSSVIIQAPAGSGKTELLTQRFLVLLAEAVQVPEEVLAITFTKKAAAEMRIRILAALQRATDTTPPETDYAKNTWELARRVLARDQELSWNILNNPNRLRIQTIDSLCASLTRQMPILSRFGAQPNISAEPQTLYQKAVYQLLETLEQEVPWQSALKKVLLYLDNNYQKIETLLTSMLARRDQWLSYVIGARKLPDFFVQLEQGLENIIIETVSAAEQAIPNVFKQELLSLAQFAAEQCERQENNSPIIACKNLTEFPGVNVEDLPYWRGLAALLLTNANTWRKTVNKNTGFPPAKTASSKIEKQLFDEMKEKCKELLTNFANFEELRLALQDVVNCPQATFSAAHKDIVAALMTILPILAAQLKLAFKEVGEVDYTEISLAALQALGAIDNPTDLALMLDHKIQHLLVDEFQDTSISQFQLLENLVAGWQPEDGRTLFIVGDPMQSIYRFREAEVGLFLRAKQQGIGGIQLKSLRLKVNFRSEPEIINWVNQSFSHIMPARDNLASGAISFYPSTTIRRESSASSVYCYPLEEDAEQQIAVASIIKETRKNDPAATIAILVRARPHVFSILEQLKSENINFQAVEIESLRGSMLISDLLSLTKALLHPADRVAWLSILRAPWCGFTLADLHCLAAENNACLWERIMQAEVFSQLSEDGKSRLNRILPMINHALSERQRQSLASLVRKTWLNLGGAACVTDKEELPSAELFFDFLQEQEICGDIINMELFEQKLEKLFAKAASNNDNPVQVMTIHKSKGLEFDVVIIPGLERRPPQNERQLLMWAERPNMTGGNDLLVAPMTTSQSEQVVLYDYLRRFENEKDYYEMGRLFYVAVTRAKKQCYLLATVAVNPEKNESVKPAANSFLAMIWEEFCQMPFYKNSEKRAKSEVESIGQLRRLKLDRFPPEMEEPIMSQGFDNKNVVYHWQEPFSQHVGTLAHRYLNVIAAEGLEKWSTEKIQQRKGHIKNALLRLGVLEHRIYQAADLVIQALTNAISDSKGRWILQAHQHAYCEYPLTAVVGDKIIHAIFDRTFVDNDVRWIIDYKIIATTQDAIKRYKSQLWQYANMLSAKEKLVIKCGLYFPLDNGWYEFDFNQVNQSNLGDTVCQQN